jgi:copper chaperone NosL
MNNQTISFLSKTLLVIAVIMLLVSIFVPIWRIELAAPQYPEGLVMLIYANKLGGDVEIINGLNHYIGMATLHAENFIEFAVLPYIITGYALLVLLTAFVARKKMLYFTFTAFALFGILAMVDFWRWEYNYGHNLDPNAAIIVPGMAYQPPLIGYKQLLNFGAFSVPDIGGWLFIISGLLLLVVVLLETKALNRFKKVKTQSVALFILPLFLIACNNIKPDPIKLNKDSCAFCKMTISDGRFAAESITKKGRIYKFDDLSCMLLYQKENPKTSYQSFWVNNYLANNVLISAETAFYVSSEKAKSPMRGDIAAFASKEQATNVAKEWKAEVKNWIRINK